MTTQELMQQLANDCGVDIESVETMAKMCADRIETWGVDVNEEMVELAVIDGAKSHKAMCIQTMTRMESFSNTISNMAAH